MSRASNPPAFTHRARLDLSWDKSNIRTNLLPTLESMWIVNHRNNGLRKSWSDARDGLQPLDPIIALSKLAQLRLHLGNQVLYLPERHELNLQLTTPEFIEAHLLQRLGFLIQFLQCFFAPSCPP